MQLTFRIRKDPKILSEPEFALRDTFCQCQCHPCLSFGHMLMYVQLLVTQHR